MSVTKLITAIVLGTAFFVSVKSADASTFNVYGFTQDGYTSPLFSQTSGKLTGTFGATVGPSGQIGLADLAFLSFQLDVFGIDQQPGGDVPVHLTFADIATTTFFSFNINGGASSLGFVAGDIVFGTPGQICVGAPAAFGVCGLSGNFAGMTSLIFTRTVEQPDIVLISSTETPLPGALPLFASGLAAMGLFGFGRKRKPAPAAA